MSLLLLAAADAFAIGTQVAVAVLAGQKSADVRRVVGSFVVLAAAAGAALACVCAVAVPGIAAAFGVPPQLTGTFVLFSFAMVGVNVILLPGIVLHGALRADNRQRLALGLDAVYAVGNMGFVALFVGHWGLFTLAWAAGASAIANLAASAVVARRAGLIGAIRLPRAAFATAARFLVRVGVPVALSTVVLFASNFAYLWILEPFGAQVASGFSLAYNVQIPLIMPALALGSAISIVMNQRVGVPQRVFAAGMTQTALVYAVVAAGASALHGPLLRMLHVPPLAAAQADLYLGWVAPTFVLLGPVIVVLSVLEQTGSGALAVGLNVVYFGSIVVAGGMLARAFHDPAWLYGVTAAANVAGIAGLLIGWRAVTRGAALEGPLYAGH